MCGIVGYFDKSGSRGAATGARLLAMLTALGCRGPDSSGAAVWGAPGNGFVLRVKVGDHPDDARRREIIRRLRRLGRVRSTAAHGAILRVELARAEPAELVNAVEGIAPDVEVLSLGHQLELVKQVEAPRNLEAEFGVSKMAGTHGLGHTRLSTESRVDLSHSQPFWAHGTPDLAVVHNGHITNYHRLRRLYEQEGVRFYTENDSEIIGIYLARKLARGSSLGDALSASVRELDGSFSYIAATAEAFGFAKDPFCLKPLLVGENAEALAIANEEVAIHAALDGEYRARESGAGAVSVWEVPRSPIARAPRGRRAA